MGSEPDLFTWKILSRVKPTSPGYASYTVEPNLGGLQWMQGKVPTPKGDIEMYVNKVQIKITGATGEGTLRIRSKVKPTGRGIEVLGKGGDVYEIIIQPGIEYLVSYESL